MPSRQDQLHSYQYSQQRVVAALVTHDPDPHRSPLRRAGTTVLVSLVVAALAVGGAAVYGLIKGNGTVDADKEDVVWLEKGTGARFVYVASDSKIHPVLNYTSGLLIANAAAPQLKNASRESLAKIPLGDPLGIPDAPDSLPDAKNGLLPSRWTVCTSLPEGSEGGGARSVVSIGVPVTDGTLLPVPKADTPGSELRGLLVTDTAGRAFLVYNNKRFLIPANRLQQTQVRFGWTQAALEVSPAWLNSVTLGPDLKAPKIDGFSNASSAINDTRIGQLLQISGPNGSVQWGVVLDDGVADLTEVQATLMQTEPNASSLQTMDLNLYSQLPHSKTNMVSAANADGLPPAFPVLLNGPGTVCTNYDGGNGGSISIRIGSAVPQGTAVTGEPAVAGGVQADEVLVPRGKGALVVSAASPDAPATSGTVSVITDTGRRYPLASRDLLGKLGYGGVQPQAIPGQLVALLPQGPALDPVRARLSNASEDEDKDNGN
ncbi:type VII secretion protein EccB [Actinoplanes sp. NPDC051494]|uniref:type VII secretion protein EccB n=1 Tax=Actinoplanes sp. NPDC051494 TaxID=3363907 RepID=UPI003798F103